MFTLRDVAMLFSCELQAKVPKLSVFATYTREVGVWEGAID